MSLTDYITRLRNGGKLPGEILSARLESGCSDCGRRLTLDREISVSVCQECQSTFLRIAALDNPSEARILEDHV